MRIRFEQRLVVRNTMDQMDQQHTIARSTSLAGRGLFSGVPVKLTFSPAPANHGIVFSRTDLGGAQVPALVKYVVKRARRTALRQGDAIVETTEHCMSALAAMGIDNVLIELDAAELPAMDGSAQPFTNAIREAGIKSCEAARRTLVIDTPTVVRLDDAMMAAVPSNEPGMEIVYDLDYGSNNPIGRQLKIFHFHRHAGGETASSKDAQDPKDAGKKAEANYLQEIGPARTFCLEAEALALREAGLGSHLSPDEVLVLGENGPLGKNRLRFADEPVRHKIVDLIGDLYLVGAAIQGKIIASKSGHPLNHMLARKLVAQLNQQVHHDLVTHRTVLDIRKLTRILPHRYPMLLVDRVIEIDGDRRALGVKNVTINEPFFQGHYPNMPIMPGVLVVEAMAQLSGVLIAQKLEQVGKLAVLLSLDRVKLRRPITPGDQVILEAETVRVRTRIAHMRCRAYVGEEIAAEAEVKFMLVDDEQE